MFTIIIPKSTVRNPYAVDASARKASVFKHKTAPRGGGRNQSRDFLDEYLDQENE